MEDSFAVSLLTGQLSSNTFNNIVNQQIREIIANQDHDVLIALKDEEVVGYIHCFKAIRLTSKPFIEICGLVVDEKVRGNGIGRKLVEHVEKLYLNSHVIRVRCNEKRELAHKFYLGLEYEVKKEQKIFEKNNK